MKEERYVIGTTESNEPNTYRIAQPAVGAAEDIMAAEMFDDVDDAIVALYSLNKTNFANHYNLFKITIQINKLWVSVTEIPDTPIPREPIGSKGRASFTPNI